MKSVKKSHEPYQAVNGEFVGDKVQIDIKYIPQHCIEFPSYGKKYYQITAIDEFSRKRALRIVDEKSTFETGQFSLRFHKTSASINADVCIPSLLQNDTHSGGQKTSGIK